MKILVFVKQVLDSEAKINIQDDKKSLDFEERFSLNFFDEFAIEEAIRVKEKVKNCEVVAVSLGSRKAQEVLRTSIAMGVDRAVLIETEKYNIWDPYFTAKVLSGFAEKEGFNLIFCGERAMDDENGVVGVLIAENLKIPYVGSVVKIEVMDTNKVVVDSEIDGSFFGYEVELPALFSLRKGINEPRVPAITGVMKAMRAQIAFVDPYSLLSIPLTQKTEIVRFEFPGKRPAVKIIEGQSPEEKVKKLISLLKQEAKVI
ncbi:MAG: electron transfer flavoprotein subunit beta/FixA family protein [Deltaproteobacteria bacterium]|nr:electron transfer flavoprotein subunit beta/FixA family protein [Deltaproteobacteria bacterium]